MVTITRTYNIGGREKTLTVTAPSGEEALALMERMDPSALRFTRQGRLGEVHAEPGNVQLQDSEDN